MTQQALKGLNSPNPSQIVASLLTLKDSADRSALPQVRQLLTAPDDRVRWAAVYVIGCWVDRSSAALIVNALEDQNKWVRVAAVEAVARLKLVHAVPQLITRLSDGENVVQLAAINALADLGGAQARSALQNLLTDNTPVWLSRGETLAQAAKDALARLKAPEIIPVPVPQPVVSPITPSTPDFDSMSPDELMAWMESLAKRQGAHEELTTSAHMELPDVEADNYYLPKIDYKPPAKPINRWVDERKSLDDTDDFDLALESPEPVVDALPDWLKESLSDEGEAEEIPDWLRAEDVQSSEMPEWLKETLGTGEVEAELPDWLAQETPVIVAPAMPIKPISPITPQPEDAVSTAQFSAYYPAEAQVKQRHGLYVYAHVEAALQNIRQDVEKYKAELGGQINTPKTAKKSAELAHGTPITVVPQSDDIEFEPETLTKKWKGGWSRFEFEFTPTADQADETALVRVSIQVGGIEIAHVNCAIDIIQVKPAAFAVANAAESLQISNPLAAAKLKSQTVTPYQRIFISYSRKDSAVAKAFKLAQTALGNEAFLDVDNLRTGENWQAALAKAIDEADIFQLFWSESSAFSDFCRYEWDYALRFRCHESQCETFIRPVYWEKPMPEPPQELSHLNFRFVPLKD